MKKTITNELKNKLKNIPNLPASSLLKFETALYFRNLINCLNYIYNCEFNRKNMLTRDIILKLPIENGYKLFYVKKGIIVFKEKYGKIDDSIMKDLIKNGENTSLDFDVNLYEKGILDFQDILFSEIQTLPEESVIIRGD